VPRFSEEAREHNQKLINVLAGISQEKNASPAQISLAWLLAQKPWIVPIPGTTKMHRMQENFDAIQLQLSADDIKQITEATSQIEVQGDRYSAAAMEALAKS